MEVCSKIQVGSKIQWYMKHSEPHPASGSPTFGSSVTRLTRPVGKAGAMPLFGASKRARAAEEGSDVAIVEELKSWVRSSRLLICCSGSV